MEFEPYLQMAGHTLLFCFWSSLWPRQFVKERLEPLVGFRTYRLFYVIGTVFLFGNTLLYLFQHSGQSAQLWNFTAIPGYRYILNTIGTIGIFFFFGTFSLGLSFWGLKNPPTEGGLQTGGYYKITRHPLYWSVFCLLLGHTLRLGSALAVLWFVLLETYNVFGVVVFENPGLKRQYGEEWVAFKNRVSTIPFLSLLRGDVKFEPGEFPTRRFVGAGVFAAIVIFFLHDVLIWLCYYLPPLGTVTEKVISEYQRIFG